MSEIAGDWLPAVQEEFHKPYYKDLYLFVRKEYETHTVYPPAEDIFDALHLTPLSKVRVVILGQDPYHEPGQAHGLCFSVPEGVPAPPSLVNIRKELKSDLGIEPPPHGNLEGWARQGVLLLNASLTVRAHEANSHKGKGWEVFTDRIISILNDMSDPIVFILWGAKAGAKKELITNPAHCIITGAHPSPLSAHRGFFGGNYFSRTNEFLISNGREPINWSIL